MLPLLSFSATFGTFSDTIAPFGVLSLNTPTLHTAKQPSINTPAASDSQIHWRAIGVSPPFLPMLP